jgi:hypothetical protein
LLPPDPSNYGNLQELRAFAKLSPEQQLKIAKGSNHSVTIDSVLVDVNVQRLVFVSTEVGPYKALNALVPLNNRGVLCLLIRVQKSRYDEFLPQLNVIANSLNANPQFKLTDHSVPSLFAASDVEPWWAYVIGIPLLIVLFAGPSFVAFRRHLKSRYWILTINILALFGGGFPGLLLWIWAGCGKAEPKPAKMPRSPS